MKEKINQYISKFKVARSLKVRIFFIILLVGIVPTAILRYGILQNYEQRAVEVRISDVQTQFKILANHLITYNYLQDTSSEIINAELEQLSNLYGGGITAVETPGHADDSICWKLPDDSGIFTGDTLFVDYIGFCNAYKMFHSLERLRQLPDDMNIYSGHDYGHVPVDTIGHQKKVNPFFAPETFSGFKQALLDLK